MSTNPNLIVDPAATSATEFRATDALNGLHYIHGKLIGSELSFAVVARTPGANRGVSGREFFAAMVEHFGEKNIQVIRGQWSSGIDMDANIDRFNALVSAGYDEIDAAKLTWTGQRAMAYQFTNVRIDLKNPASSSGNYFEVVVTFRR
jgi:hypothetical protein